MGVGVKVIRSASPPIDSIALTPKEAAVVLWHLQHQNTDLTEGQNSRALRLALEAVFPELPGAYGA